MIKGQKAKFILLTISAFFVTSSLFTNCAKDLPADVSKTQGQSLTPPVPLTATYLPTTVRVLSSVTITPAGGKSPYTMSKLSGAGTFVEISGTYTASNTVEEAVFRITDADAASIDVRINILPLEVSPGTQSFTQPGNYNFTVPTYNSLVVEVWGAGAGGQHCGVANGFPFCLYGNSGGTSIFGANLLVAQGGQGVNGGTASGGTLNIRGENGNWNGTNCPGLGGAAAGPMGPILASRQGAGPGGGGNGLCIGWGANGGGGGGYTVREYRIGELGVGSVIPGTVGGGGGAGGAGGLVKITWR